MIRFAPILVAASLLAASLSGQSPADQIKSRIEGLQYVRLAEMARVQGDVRISHHSDTLSVISGSPLLVPLARQTTATLVSLMGLGDSEFIFHFILTDSGTMTVANPRVVKRGNAFERVILRALGRKTEKTVTEYECREVKAPPSNFRINGASIEIWIYGRELCVMPNSSNLVAKR